MAFITLSLHPVIINSFFAKFDIDLSYPPPYERKVWDYSRANSDCMKLSLNGINWKRAFVDWNPNEKVSLLNELLLNVIENFIPRKIVKCVDKDPIRMTNGIKRVCRKKS